MYCLGCFQTSPSVYVDAAEPSLDHRRLKLYLNNFLKIKSLPENLRLEPIINLPTPEQLYPKLTVDLEAYNRYPTLIDSQYEGTPP